MAKVNESFSEHRNVMDDATSSNIDRETALNSYLHEREAVHYEVLKTESDAWSTLVGNNEAKSLWSMRDWKGNYTCQDMNEISNMSNLQSDITIPVLDDPISEHEVDDALKSMNNGGFDYNLPLVSILISCFSHTILLLLNSIFLVR